MEAYELFAKDLFNIVCKKKTFGIYLGWLNCAVYGVITGLITFMSLYKVLAPNGGYNSTYDLYTTKDPSWHTTTSDSYSWGNSYNAYTPYYYNSYDYNRYEKSSVLTSCELLNVYLFIYYHI